MISPLFTFFFDIETAQNVLKPLLSAGGKSGIQRHAAVHK
jgi:hypothetical protein